MQTRGIGVLLVGIAAVFMLILWFSRFAHMSTQSIVDGTTVMFDPLAGMFFLASAVPYPQP